MGQGSHHVTPKVSYIGTTRAQFAAGFLFGIHQGGFNLKDLDVCLDKENTADKIFHNALDELKEALKEDAHPESHNWGQQIAVRSLRAMAEFIYDMATEKSGKSFV